MANEILVTRGLTKRYGNHLAVDHVELSIQKGQIYGLVGRNGAGKTTIIRMVTAQTVPTEGEVSLFGASGERELSKMRPHRGHGGDAQLLSLPDRPAEPGVLPHPAGHSRPAGGGRGAGGGGSGGHGEEDLQELLPGHEAAAGAGPGADEPAGPPAAGRADQRTGPGGHRGVPKPAAQAQPGAADHHSDLQPHPVGAGQSGHLLRLPGQRHDAGADFRPGAGGKVPRLY